MNSNIVFTEVNYQPQLNNFDTTGVDDLSIPEYYKNKVHKFFEDLTSEPLYKKLSNKSFVQTSIFIVFISAFVLILSTMIQISYQSRFGITTLNSTNQNFDQFQQNRQIKTGIHLGIIIFLCFYIILFTIIVIVVQQSFAKKEYALLKIYENKELGNMNKLYRDVFEITPLVKRKKLFRLFNCFFIFNFCYHIEIHYNKELYEIKKSADSENNYLYHDITVSRSDIQMDIE